MSIFAAGAFHGTRYIKESVFGQTPDAPQLKTLRHTSNSLVLTKDSFQSQELRADAQISDLRHGQRRAGGEIGLEFSYGEYDDFLAAALRSEWIADGAARCLTAGTTMSSFTIERAFGDIGRYENFTGCEVSSLSLTIATNAMVTGTMTLVGRAINFTDAPLCAECAPGQAAPPFDGFAGRIREGGSEVAVVTSLELMIDNAIEPAFVLGSDSAASLTPGRINVTGTLSAYFSGMELLNKFVNETESSLQFTLGDGQHQSYTFTLPRIKYSGGDNPVDSEGPVMLSMPFQALYDQAAETNLRIDAFA
ncbi:MAG: hypothetical protein LBV79_04530 [Candidatus Adiutrix sp.]|jgi:hypothetical protein|nr:hypothetical protein [Candidatus Adiutrix sp.]